MSGKYYKVVDLEKEKLFLSVESSFFPETASWYSPGIDDTQLTTVYPGYIFNKTFGIIVVFVF